jgi:hypothetical protein
VRVATAHGHNRVLASGRRMDRAASEQALEWETRKGRGVTDTRSSQRKLRLVRRRDRGAQPTAQATSRHATAQCGTPTAYVHPPRAAPQCLRGATEESPASLVESG